MVQFTGARIAVIHCNRRLPQALHHLPQLRARVHRKALGAGGFLATLAGLQRDRIFERPRKFAADHQIVWRNAIDHQGACVLRIARRIVLCHSGTVGAADQVERLHAQCGAHRIQIANGLAGGEIARIGVVAQPCAHWRA